MCGIAGAVWTAKGKPLDREVLARMLETLKHRGPDGSGENWDELADGSGAALGHRRLAIIDVEGGRQPLSNEDDTVWISFNGEIYNYMELRSRLEAAGHRFRSDSDTETIVHLYEQEGINCLQHLRGMFAFAIWDSRHRRLLLARDRFGQKPLVYRAEPHRLLFASEIKALLQEPEVPRVVDPVALDEYLTYFYVPHPRTMIQGICKLPPSHYAIYERGHLQVRRYWTPDLNHVLDTPLKQLREELYHEVEESVRLRLRSDVPLGAFLSGGIDSAVVVGLMQSTGCSATKTFTVGFPVSEYDESATALLTARHLKTDHRSIQVRPDSVGILPTLAWYYDEPFGDSSAIPTHYVSRFTREHVKVALTGDGGDELFGGYPRYATVERVGLIDRLPRFLRSIVANRLWSSLPGPNRQNSILRRLKFRMELLKEPAARRYVNWVAHITPGSKEALYSGSFARTLPPNDSPTDFFSAAISQCASRCAGSQAMLADVLTYLPCDLLTKVDMAGMAHGLECRSPFLDHRVAELAMAIPYQYKIRGPKTKAILRETFAEFIPRIVRERGKAGFRIPLGGWFRGELNGFVRDVLLSACSLERGYFQPESIRSLIDEHTTERWDHGDRIWALLCLEFWHQTYLTSSLPSLAPPECSEHLSAVDGI